MAGVDTVQFSTLLVPEMPVITGITGICKILIFLGKSAKFQSKSQKVTYYGQLHGGTSKQNFQGFLLTSF